MQILTRLRPATGALVAAVGAATFIAATVSGQGRPTERFTGWTAPTFPVAEYVVRQRAVLARLDDNDILLVPSAEGTSTGETFRQLDDFEYLAGLEVSRSVLAIDRRAGRVVLFAPRNDPRFENAARPNDFPGRPLVGDPALRALSGVDAVAEYSALGAFIDGAKARGARILINLGRARVPVPVRDLARHRRCRWRLPRANCSRRNCNTSTGPSHWATDSRSWLHCA